MRFLAAAGLVTFMAGIASYYATEELSLLATANLIAGPTLLIVAAVAQTRRFRGFSGGLARRVALRWGLILSATVAVVLALNVLAASWTAALDLTAERQYTLSDQSLELCAELREELSGSRPELLLFEDALLAKDVRLLVSAYGAACPIDARELLSRNAPPEAAAILESYDTTVVACHENRCEYVGYPSEENITNAMIRLVRNDPPRVYFNVGHGEADLRSERDHGFTELTAALRNEGMELHSFLGAANDEIPSDASVLVIAGPERSMLPGELDALDRYLTRGGRLLVLLEPGSESNLIELLERWGFGLPQAVVSDRQSSPLLDDTRAVSLVVNRFGSSHAITRKMNARTMVLMPGTRPVLARRKPEPQDDLAELVYSSPGAWAETDVGGALSGRAIAPDPGELSGGELPLAASGRYPRGQAEARIVVIGDQDLASNRWIRSLYNADLVLNTILWLADDETRVAIRPKGWTPDTQPLPLETTLAYFYSLAIALPQLLLLLGIHAWYRQTS